MFVAWLYRCWLYCTNRYAWRIQRCSDGYHDYVTISHDQVTGLYHETCLFCPAERTVGPFYGE